jgi:outer membrane protein TolC
MVVARSVLGTAFVAAFASAALAGSDDEDPSSYVVPDFMAQPPPLPPNADAANVWKLDLAGAIQVALHQNTGVVVERLQVGNAALGVEVAKGEFEPVVNASADTILANTPGTTTTQTGGALGVVVNSHEQDWALQLADRLESGAQASITFANTRTAGDVADFDADLFYNSSLIASITQPIARGFSADLVVPRADILRAKITSQRERAQLDVVAQNIVQQTENAYWNVVLALYSYDLQVHSQKRAEDQLALTHRQIDAGLLPPSDLITAETTLAQRKLLVVQAEQQLSSSSDQLRSVMNVPREQWSRPIVPTDLPSFAAKPDTAEGALGIALEHRPELVQLALDLKTALVNLRLAENNELPQINVGVSGSLLGAQTAYGSDLALIDHAKAAGYELMLNLSWTPLNRAAGANADISRSNQRVAVANRDQALQDTWFLVRDAVRNQASTERQVLAAAKFRLLATENLAVEQRKFTSGTSSNFFIAQRQEDLANAQLAELQAVLAHKQATVALLRAEGTLLDERHVQLGDGLH